MVDVAGPAPSATTEPGDLAAFVETDLDSCTDAELIDRLLDAQRMRARLDACVVALTDRFDARTVWAADGARNAPGWVTARVGVSYGQAKADLALARDLRRHPQITAAHRAGRLTQAQVRALLTARGGGLEDAFDLCEEVLVAEVATATLAAGRRFLARWAQEIRERFAIAEPDGPEPDGGGGPVPGLALPGGRPVDRAARPLRRGRREGRQRHRRPDQCPVDHRGVPHRRRPRPL